MPASNGLQLLIAEDSTIVRERLVALAREHLPANAICSVATGADAVAVFDRSNPDAVLLDLGLPDMTGIEVLEHIRRRGSSAEVVVFTNWAGPEMAARCHLLGANHFISKAHDIGAVIEILRTITSRKTVAATVPIRPAAEGPPVAGINPVAVLVVEDDASQAELLVKLLRPRLPQGSSVACAASQAEALEHVRHGRFDVVLLDLGLPDAEGAEAVVTLRLASPGSAITVLSAHADDTTVDAAMQGGADDYFIKGELTAPSIARAVISAAKRNRSARALTTALESRRRIMDSSVDVICTLDAAGRFVEVGAACERLWGYAREELIGRISTEWVAAPDRGRSEEFLAAVRGGATTHGFENQFVRKDGSFVDMMWSAAWSTTDHLMYCVARDITERKRNEETLRATIASSLDCIITVDESDAVLEFNPAAEQTFGWSRAEALGRRLTDLIIPPEFRAGHARTMTQLVEPDCTRVLGTRIEIMVMRSDGLHFPAEMSLVRVGKGRPARFTAFLRGITERVSARQQLEAQKEQYRLLFESNPNAMWVYDLESLRILAANDAAVAQYGYSQEEFLELTLLALRPAVERDKVIAAIRSEGDVRRHAGTWTHQRKDGSLLLVDVHTSPTTFEGAPARMAVLLNVTEQKQAEEALRRSEERYGLVVSGSNAGIFDDDLLTGETYYSPRFREILGFARDYAPDLATFLSDVVHPDDRQYAEAAVEQHFTARLPYAITCRLRTQSGGVRWCNVHGQALWDASGKPFRMAGSITDITEQKEAEAAAARTLQRLNDAQRIGQIGDWAWDIATEAITWSPQVFTILGRDPSLGPPRTYDEYAGLYDAGNAAILRESVSTAMTSGEGHEHELLITRADGQRIHIHGLVVPRKDEAGQVIGLSGTVQDITTRKRTEAAASRLLSVLEASLNEIYIFDADTLRFEYVNECALRNLGYPMETMRAKTPLDLKPEFTAELFHELIAPLHRRDEPKVVFETVHRRADASLYPVEVHLQLVERAEKTVFLAVVNDITSRRRAEEELRQKDSLIRIASRMTDTGGWALEIAEQRVFWSDEVCDILEYPRGAVPSLAEGLALYSEPARQVVQAGLEACARDGTPFDAEVDVSSAKGRRISVRLCCEAERDAAGNVTRVQGAFQDISRRRRAEAALREAHAKYRSLVENAVEGIFQTTPDGAFLSANPALARMAGFDSPDELMRERNGLDGYSHADPVKRQEFYRLMETEGFVNDFEYDTTRKDGSVFSVSESARIVRDDAGNPLYYEGSVRDITQRKRAEEELEELNKQLVEISRQAGMAEVATSVLHNVGNVLNSVNVSCSVISDTVRKSRISTVNKAAELLREHAEDLPTFLTTDPAGKKLPELLGKLAQRLAEEQATVLGEARALTENVAHIKDIVAVQQSYAGNIGGIRETLGLDVLMEDALRMNNAALIRHRIEVVREFSEVPAISVEKHKVLQILVNLIRNAKHALTDSGREDKRLILRIADSNGRVELAVVDNGIGIAPENLTRIFAHGFTTKKDGHGFGLHSGAIAAQEMGGSLTVQSDGIGHGAVFTLSLPTSNGHEARHKESSQP